jgi:hypothetical protein
MTLSLSQETYTQAVVAQQAQIQALQSKVQELQARIEVWSSNQFYSFKTNQQWLKSFQSPLRGNGKTCSS